jgi:hypothetical protein
MIEVKYFDSPGRADVIRILLQAAKVEKYNCFLCRLGYRQGYLAVGMCSYHDN